MTEAHVTVLTKEPGTGSFSGSWPPHSTTEGLDMGRNSKHIPHPLFRAKLSLQVSSKTVAKPPTKAIFPKFILLNNQLIWS